MGLSENSVPLHPMVLLIIIPIKWLFHWEYTIFSDIAIWKNKDRNRIVVVYTINVGRYTTVVENC